MSLTSSLFADDSNVDIGLYIGLEPNSELSFRVAAEAALAFDLLVHDFAEAGNLGRDVDLNLISGEAGSLHLKGVLRSIQDKVKLRAIAIALAAFIAGMAQDEIKDYIRQKLLGEKSVHISEESIQEIVEACMVAVTDENSNKSLSKLTDALKKDPDVTSVGATIDWEAQPTHVRSRANFNIVNLEQAALTADIDETFHKRTKTVRETVILTEPVLTTSAKRKWRVVREGGKEIAASMEDEVFWSKLVAGETGLSMSGGVHLTVRLQVKSEQDKETNVWKDTEYNIQLVESWTDGQVQSSLPFNNKDRNQDDG